jgi:hypothetical protein
MKPLELKSMSVDELWSLHELVSAELARKITVETARLDQRLRQLGQVAVSVIIQGVQRAAHTRRFFRNISKSCGTVRDLGGLQEEATLAGCGA